MQYALATESRIKAKCINIENVIQNVIGNKNKYGQKSKYGHKFFPV